MQTILSSSEQVLRQLEKTQAAASLIRNLDAHNKATLLHTLAESVASNMALILAANANDVARMNPDDPKRDRLLLTEDRVLALAASIRAVASLPDPSGQTLLQHTMDNGVRIRKITVPLGVVGVIYESRPNVTLDVSALCLRSGNAAVLRGGSDAWETNSALVALIQDVLEYQGLSREVVTLLPPDRELVMTLLHANRLVDILIPRGSEGLIRFVREHARIPVIETGAGVCHTYVQEDADLEKARAVVVNAKVSRPSVCNALDTVLVDAGVAAAFLPSLLPEFDQWKVDIYADETAFELIAQVGYARLHRAAPSDFGKEFLGYGCSVKVVSGLDEALQHIRHFSSRHSEAIISENQLVCARFLNEVDAAAVYSNVSTRFTDGGSFGLGAEIGISTQKLHARGPFALEKLVTEKWIGEGEGQTRW
ncbi:MAG: glutamate-5-semialdehyde dehydrogenase [Haliscomenobacter sp.]